MKKRFLLLLFLIISLPISSAKEITLTEIINYKIENIIVEEGILKLLINNPSDKYLQFYIIVNDEEVIITKEIIKPLTSNFISIPSKSNFIKEITITPGFQSQDKQDLYLYKSTTRTIQVNREVTPIEPEQEQTNLQVINSDSNKIYVYGNGLIASNNNDEITYYVNDVLGSNVIETNSQGDKINEITYDVYGQVLGGNANDRVSFTGKELDSSGLQYFGARYYDSSTGRFTQTDPILRDSESNYHYANNNPLKFVDKDGNDARLIHSVLERNPLPSMNSRQLQYMAASAGLQHMLIPQSSKEFAIGIGLAAIIPPTAGFSDDLARTLFSQQNDEASALAAKTASKIYPPNEGFKIMDAGYGIDYSRGAGKALLQFKDGLVYDQSGKKYSGKVIWTVSDGGELRMATMKVQEEGRRISHATLAEGKAVEGAGTATISRGGITAGSVGVSARTGHYYDRSNPSEFNKNSLTAFWKSAQEKGLRILKGAYSNIRDISSS